MIVSPIAIVGKPKGPGKKNSTLPTAKMSIPILMSRERIIIQRLKR